MKKTIVITTLLATVCLTSNNTYAASSTEENVGFLSGALSGAAVGGPIGFFVGGIAGVLLGEQVQKANQLDATKAQLAKTNEEYSLVQQELVSVKQQVDEAQSELVSTSKWLTEGLSLELLFTTNSAELSTKDQNAIGKLANLLAEYPELKLKLDGFADQRGKQLSNLKLSLARAESVQKALLVHGVDTTRLIIEAHGESTSENTKISPDELALERRVSVNFIIGEDSTVAQN